MKNIVYFKIVDIVWCQTTIKIVSIYVKSIKSSLIRDSKKYLEKKNLQKKRRCAVN